MISRWLHNLWRRRPHELVALIWMVAFGLSLYDTAADWPMMIAVAQAWFGGR